MYYSADTLYEALISNTWPDSPAAISDFGLDTSDADRIYAILLEKLKTGEVTKEQLREASGDEKLVGRLVGFPVKIGF